MVVVIQSSDNPELYAASFGNLQAGDAAVFDVCTRVCMWKVLLIPSCQC